MTATQLLKRLYYPLYHRVRNSGTLTAAMFHRVLERTDPRYGSALADWTVSTELFDECLQFFARHYHVVSLPQVLESLDSGAPLPARSLLITFDDGYADNEEYALPLLRKRGLPAALFVFSDALGSRRRPIADDVYLAWKRGVLSAEDLRAIHRLVYREGTEVAPADERSLVTAVCERANEAAPTRLAAFESRLTPQPADGSAMRPQMVTVAQLRHLEASGVSIGAHGKTHTALTRASDLDRELAEPRQVLADALARGAPGAIRALAFPFGAYDERVLQRARQAGYELILTLRPELTRLSHGRLTTRVIGRINVHGPTIAGDGPLRVEQLAYTFFRAPRAHPVTAGAYGR
jgi:peptidoglycan/xylan/chitin deacetylase (PgdA/CDA1 family)